MIKHQIQYLITFLILTVSLSGQSPIGGLQSIDISPERDTLIIQREYGDLWYGISGGFQLNNYLGDLITPSTSQINNPFNFFTNYTSGSGGGYFVGGLVEWKPKGEKWGIKLNINFFDQRNFTSTTKPKLDSSYELNIGISQLVFSPSAVYHFPIEGLHATGGFNIEYVLKNSGNQYLKFNNTSHVRQEYKAEFTEPKIGVGINLGLAYDFFIADFNKRARILISPFIDLNLRSSIVSDNNSSWYSSIVRFGFSFKFGSDEIKVDTLYFDPSYEPPVEYISTVRSEKGVFFTSYIPIEERISANISIVEVSEVKAIAAVETKDENNIAKKVKAELPVKRQTNTNPDVVSQKPSDLIPKKGAVKAFSFATSSSTAISPDLKKYLNNVADFHKSNPGSRIIVIGHSDNVGTTEQIAERARQRAVKVKEYLLSQGVPDNKVIATWQPNSTEAGRRENRRVEITIQE
jgi:outer membrane protein OmpA-like peptidoglycan-associated protein